MENTSNQTSKGKKKKIFMEILVLSRFRLTSSKASKDLSIFSDNVFLASKSKEIYVTRENTNNDSLTCEKKKSLKTKRKIKEKALRVYSKSLRIPQTTIDKN